jgi:acetyl esterase/lipase
MEIVPTITTTLPEGIALTYQALLPHLAANEKTIREQYDRRETHSYGPDPRQELDVYYPHHYDDNMPVLIFLFGGGFFMGDKQNPNHPNLIHANLGAYFCDKGFISIVANYRLTKGPTNPNGNARYPSGGEDTAGTVKWITKNLGKQRNVFLMGHSVGAVHVMTFLFEPALLKSVEANIVGVVLISPPCHQRTADPKRASINVNYYGEDVDANSPMSLLVKNGPVSIPILSLVASLDEAGIITSWADFKQEYVKLGGKYDELILEGHNHISPMLSLNSNEPEGSKWGADAAKWMLKQVQGTRAK